MGEHLGAILCPLVPERLDPLGRAEVEVGAAGPGNLPVGDVADEHMPDGILRFARHRGAAVAAHELLALERVQLLLRVPGRDPGDRSDRAQPEHLPDNRGSLEQRFLVRLERVEPRGNDALHRLRHLRLGRVEPPRLAVAESRPRSLSIRMYSSAKSGFPSARREQRLLHLRREHSL